MAVIPRPAPSGLPICGAVPGRGPPETKALALRPDLWPNLYWHLVGAPHQHVKSVGPHYVCGSRV